MGVTDLEGQRRLLPTICGDSGSDDHYNPSFVYSEYPLAHPVTFFVNEAPRDLSEIRVHLKAMALPDDGELDKTIAALLELGALRVEEGRYWANSTVITAADWGRIIEVGRPFVQSLAARIARQREQLLELIRAAAVQAPDGDLLFLTVGCFGLDWGGLAVLQAGGHSGPDRSFPGGGHYVPFAVEDTGGLHDKVYDGSHTGEAGGYVFLTFGDHSGARDAFPDLAWRLPRQVASMLVDPPAASAVAQWAWATGEELMASCGRAVARAAGRPGVGVAGESNDDAAGGTDKHRQELYEALGYIRDGRPGAPFFPADAGEPVGAAACVVQSIVDGWAAAEMRNLEVSLAGIAPVRNRVPMGEIINAVWHILFAQVNRTLAEGGFMTDPTPRGPGRARFLAMVGEERFYKTLTTAIRWK